MNKRVHITVSGVVQGVFYRKYTANKCMEFDILGSVENLPNGKVFIDAISNDLHLDKLIKWCWTGSPFSNVTGVEVNEVEIEHLPKGFIIKR